MKLRHDKVQHLLDSRGWGETTFARKLGLNYSYIYRIMRGKRGIGKKFITGFIILCEKEDLNFREYIALDHQE